MPTILDLTGQRFGRLVALERVGTSRRGAIWLCRCDCGASKTWAAAQLRTGRVRACGCLRPRLELVGQRFGRLVVVSKVSQRSNGTSIWRVRCDCGEVRDVHGGNLRAGYSTSCGCKGREKLRALLTTHGMSDTAQYRSWCSMRRRCTDESDPNFVNYGGRGIRVCLRWEQSFEAFAKDMGPRPTRRHSLDRVDNDRGYECGTCGDCIARGAAPNCRWATQKEQAGNTRRNVWIEIDGIRRLAIEWCRLHGISRQLVSHRLKFGWDPARAVTELPSAQATAQGRKAGMAGQERRRARKAA